MQCFKHFYRINPVTQLLMLIAYALMLNTLGIIQSSLMLVCFTFWLVLIKARQFFNLLRRLKWAFLAIALVYGFNTPGEHVQLGSMTLGITHEGIELGLAQMIRIVSMLALLACVMSINSRSQLISGFYYLLSPLGWVGVDVKRFAVRLWLTLYYVETQPSRQHHEDFLVYFEQQLSLLFNDNSENTVAIAIERPIFRLADYICIILMLILLVKTMIKVAT